MQRATAVTLAIMGGSVLTLGTIDNIQQHNALQACRAKHADLGPLATTVCAEQGRSPSGSGGGGSGGHARSGDSGSPGASVSARGGFGGAGHGGE